MRQGRWRRQRWRRQDGNARPQGGGVDHLRVEHVEKKAAPTWDPRGKSTTSAWNVGEPGKLRRAWVLEGQKITNVWRNALILRNGMLAGFSFAIAIDL